MSGILETLVAALQANTAALQALAASQGAQQSQPALAPAGAFQQPSQPVQQPMTQQPAAVDPMAALGGVQQPMTQQPAAQTVTDQMIMDLITPHLNGPNAAAIKPKMQEVLAAMGINGLPAAQPHQYAELYTRFQQVIASFSGNPAAGAAPAATGII